MLRKWLVLGLVGLLIGFAVLFAALIDDKRAEYRSVQIDPELPEGAVDIEIINDNWVEFTYKDNRILYMHATGHATMVVIK